VLDRFFLDRCGRALRQHFSTRKNQITSRSRICS
jgi:hypothetical protein